MKYVSDITGKTYDSAKECLEAEEKFEKAIAEAKEKKEKLAAERKERATEVEDAYKSVLEAKKVYNEKLNAFCKDFGSFHMTVKTGDENPFNMFESFFRDWF